MRLDLALVLLALAWTTGAAHAAGRCTVIVDAVNMYESEPFAYASDDPLFDDSVTDSAQARDFEAYVRAHYPVRGEVKRSCTAAYDSAELRREGTYDMFGTSFRYVQTGYVPQPR